LPRNSEPVKKLPLARKWGAKIKTRQIFHSLDDAFSNNRSCDFYFFILLVFRVTLEIKRLLFIKKCRACVIILLFVASR
jgi:hypothetical protein